MAIGHSGGAFASVEAPKVDFGEIALNAQKFNEADIERQEAKKAAEAKAKADAAKDFKYTTVEPASVANGTINYALNNTISERLNTIRDIEEIQKATGELTPELRAKRDLAINSAKSLKAADTLINEALPKLPPLIAGSSKISENQVKAYENLSNRNAIAGIKQTDGDDIEISFYDTDKNGNYLMGEDGKFKILTDVDNDGNEIPLVVSIRNIANGSFAGKFYQSNDFPTIIGKYAKTVGAYDTKIENGNVTEGKKLFTDENINTLNETIRTDLRKDKKYTADILSQIAGDPTNAKKYGIEGGYNRLKKEYTDEEYKSAEKFISDRVRGSLDTGYSRTIDEPTKININNGGAGSKSIAKLSDTVVTEKAGSTPISYLIPFREASKAGTFKGIPMTPVGVGYDDKGHLFLKFSVSEGDTKTVKYGNISKSKSGKSLKSGRVYSNGPDAQADEFINIMSEISTPDGEEKFGTPDQVREWIDRILDSKGIDKNGLIKSGSNKPKPMG